MEKANSIADIVFVTVTETENNAIQLFYDWQNFTLDGDSQVFQRAQFSKDGREHTVIHVKTDEMGMTASAAITMKVIYEFRPRYVIMTGIAAGVAQYFPDQFYGDVVVPDIVWNYSVGKFVSPEAADITYGDVGFKPRSTHLSISENVLACVRQAAESPKNECHIHIGPMACGSTVVANQAVLEKQVYSQFKNTIGLDMESYAVVYAALHANEPKPEPIIIKSVWHGRHIYFDWDRQDEGQNGQPDHVGIVEKVENGYVYTIEGNSGDRVSNNKWNISHYEIYGYGTYSDA